MRRAATAILAVALACFGVWTAVAAASGLAAPSAGDKPPIVMLDAESTVEVAPDRADITVGVIGDGADPKTAMGHARERLDRLAAGLADAAEVRQVSLALRPRTHRAGRRLVTTYEAVALARVRLAGLDRLDKVIAAVADGGANRIDGVDFGLAGRPAEQTQARQRALADLEGRASQYASHAGYKGARLANLGEQVSVRPQTAVYTGAAAKAPPSPLGGGRLDLTVQLNGAFELYR